VLSSSEVLMGWKRRYMNVSTICHLLQSPFF
jgi:hypothetical protein